jgi:hypothetical protein
MVRLEVGIFSTISIAKPHDELLLHMQQKFVQEISGDEAGLSGRPANASADGLVSSCHRSNTTRDKSKAAT